MAHPLQRSFSFDNDDELGLSPHEQDRLTHIRQQQSIDPARNTQVSPPPRYTTPTTPIQRKPVSPPPVPQVPSPTVQRFSPDGSFNQFSDQGRGNGDEFQQQLPLPTDSFSSSPPRPPPHAAAHHRRVPSSEAANDGRYWGQELGYSQSTRTQSTVTPGMDNLSQAAAGGGIAGIAYGVASSNERESGLEAQRAMEMDMDNFSGPSERELFATDTPYIPRPPSYSDPARSLRQTDSYSSNMPLGSAAAMPGHATPTPGTPGHPRSDYGSAPSEYGSTQYMGGGGMYEDTPYQQRGPHWMENSAINPDDIADDGDDGFINNPKRRSVLTLSNRGSSHDMLPAAPAVGATGSAGGVLGPLGGLMGRQSKGNTASGVYGPVNPGEGKEKSEWLRSQTTGRRKMRLIVGVLIGLVIMGAVIGGIVGAVLGTRSDGDGGDGSSQGLSASEDDGNGDLGIDSAEIKELMNNPDLHKVFPGMDYTPFNAQYPECLSNPPSQNNITRDMAVLSQLTNVVRTYGTDCNQTTMIVHAFDRLELKDMKLWIGVYIDHKNQTTTDRQIRDMLDHVTKGPGKEYFKGVIVGNEALFNGYTEPELVTVLRGVRRNFTDKNIELPLATSDLGSNWTPQLASAVDVVMANVHPFFAGVEVGKAAGWTWDFWQNNDVAVARNKDQIVAEVGWPSGGGNDCGPDVDKCPTKTAGSVAGVDEMNTFMEDWICQSMANGTDYFWFEAFDEPWKVRYNKDGKEWEDKWGLMSPGRKLKDGLKIPDCDGKTV